MYGRPYETDLKELYEVKIDTQNQIIEYRPKVSPQQLSDRKCAREFLNQIFKDMSKRRKTYPYETWSYRINVEGNEEIKDMLEKIKEYPTKTLRAYLFLLGYSGIPTPYLIYLKLSGESLPNIPDIIYLAGVASGMMLIRTSLLGVIQSIKKRSLAKRLEIV